VKKSMTQSKLIDKISGLDSLNNVLPARPEGAITSHEYAEHNGVGETTARARLNRLTAQGHLRTIKFRDNSRILRGWEFVQR
jgi:Fic family protein